eukprot:jgi/Bigna1/79316/fgenesh1_pg.61_\
MTIDLHTISSQHSWGLICGTVNRRACLSECTSAGAARCGHLEARLLLAVYCRHGSIGKISTEFNQNMFHRNHKLVIDKMFTVVNPAGNEFQASITVASVANLLESCQKESPGQPGGKSRPPPSLPSPPEQSAMQAPGFLPKPVPWLSWRHWREAMDMLFSRRPAEVKEGLAVVAVWRARGNVPAAVDSTADIIGTLLAGNQRGAMEQRLQLALVIIRAVNGLLDPSQKRAHAISIASLAENMRMPRILVDIRHEATHKQLPSLELLRMAAEEALRYLHCVYWLPQRAKSQALAATETPTDDHSSDVKAADDARSSATAAVSSVPSSPHAASSSRMRKKTPHISMPSSPTFASSSCERLLQRFEELASSNDSLAARRAALEEAVAGLRGLCAPKENHRSSPRRALAAKTKRKPGSGPT